MSDDRLKLTADNDIATITFDDGKVNALDNAWFHEMLTLLDQVEASKATALILKGRDGIYSGGLNIKWLPTIDKAESVAFSQLFPNVMRRIYHFPKPTVAQMTGHAIAGGCLIACACDRRIAMSGMSVAMNEVRVNMTIPGWIIDIVKDAIPMPHVKTMLKFGDAASTDDLALWGVVESVHASASELDAATADLVSTFQGISTADFAGTKANVRDVLRQ